MELKEAKVNEKTTRKAPNWQWKWRSKQPNDKEKEITNGQEAAFGQCYKALQTLVKRPKEERN